MTMTKTEDIKTIVERIKSRLGAKKLSMLLAVVALAGAALILLTPTGERDARLSETEIADEETYNASYITSLEESLKQAISGVRGAGSAEVYLTLERGVRYIYATEAKSSGDEKRSGEGDYTQRSERESSLVVVDGENGRQPVMLEREEPSVLGVVIICEGADHAEVRQDIIELAATLCGVGTNRVKVAPMKNT